jgi:hypothetical protein
VGCVVALQVVRTIILTHTGSDALYVLAWTAVFESGLIIALAIAVRGSRRPRPSMFTDVDRLCEEYLREEATFRRSPRP